jgi:hypothetical protein
MIKDVSMSTEDLTREWEKAVEGLTSTDCPELQHSDLRDEKDRAWALVVEVRPSYARDKPKKCNSLLSYV